MPEAATLAVYGLALIVASLGPGLGWYARARRDSGPTFEEVCQAAARAKIHRRGEAPTDRLEREYIDGVDGVMAELMKAGYGASPDEMRAAYLAGGEEVEIEV